MLRRVIVIVLFAATPLLAIEEPKTPIPASVAEDLTAYHTAQAELLGKELHGLELEKVAVVDAVDTLRDTTGINIFVNWRALEAAGIGRDTLATIRLKKVTLGTAIQLMFDAAAGERDLVGATVDDGVVTISTKEDLAKNTLTRVYDVREFLGTPDRADPKKPVYDPRRVKALQRLLERTIDPKSWRENGGTAGAVRELQGQLIVTQTPPNQIAVDVLLKNLADLVNPSDEPRKEAAPFPIRRQR